VTGGFVLAVLVRVAVETARDPTSHNLWPFEALIAGSIGFVGALIGVGVVWLLRRLTTGR
jgi:NhaP-type Na+/H+ or K+/H+ antiporter